MFFKAITFFSALLFLASCEEMSAINEINETGRMEFADSNDGKNRTFLLNFSSRYKTRSLFVRNPQTGRWSHNLLEVSTARRGYSQEITIDDGSGACLYDLYYDENSNVGAPYIPSGPYIRIDKNLNVCDIQRWRIYDKRNRVSYGSYFLPYIYIGSAVSVE